jgi:hypothetical protein
VTVAVVVLLAVVIIYYLARWLGGSLRLKDNFVTPRAQEVYDSSRALFDRTHGGATYSQYKTTVPQTDPVTYTDVRNLWKKGELTPESVQTVI